MDEGLVVIVSTGSVIILIGIFLITGGLRVMFQKKITYGPSRGQQYWPHRFGTDVSWTTDKKKIIGTGFSYLFTGLIFAGIGIYLVIFGFQS